MSIITLSEFKVLKGMNVANTAQDTRITALLDVVTSAILTYIGYDFLSYYSTFKTEYFKGDRDTLFVSTYPIKDSSVTLFYLDITQTPPVYVALVEGTDFYVDYEGDCIVSANGKPFLRTSLVRGIKLVYKAGYASCPSDIKNAAADLIEYHLKQESTPAKSMGGAETMQFQPSPQGRMPTHISRILDMYRVPIK